MGRGVRSTLPWAVEDSQGGDRAEEIASGIDLSGPGHLGLWERTGDKVCVWVAVES